MSRHRESLFPFFDLLEAFGMNGGRTLLAGATAIVLCCMLAGCDRIPAGVPAENGGMGFFDRRPAPEAGDRPAWLDIYRSRGGVDVSTIDHVVIVKFESLAPRDEIFTHYVQEFQQEESFVAYRDNRDIISFLRDGYGVKITLLDEDRNLWSLEYHRPAI